MKRLALLCVLAVSAGCAKKVMDLTPGPVHEGVEFSVRPSKPSYKHGEQVMVYFDVKNTTKRQVAIFIDYRREEFGVFRSRELKGEGKEYESFPRTPYRPNPSDPPSGPVITNSSFMLLDPGAVGHVYLDTFREATPKGGGAAGPLPPGTYTYVGEYAVKSPFDGKVGDKELPFEGEGRPFYDMSPRGVWRAECTFTVTNEEAPAPPQRRRGNPPR